jgi:diguanylate cyclase (GGDEF)-like protein
MASAHSSDHATADASILLWQGRYRLLLLAAVGSVTLTLKWAGILSAESVVVPALGARTALVLTAILAGSYFAFNAGVVAYVRHRRTVAAWVVPVVLTFDVVTFHGAIFLSAPPEWYERSLILSTFSIQLTLLYFGWRPAAWTLLGVIVAYVAMLVTALELGHDLSMVESLWTLGLFTLGVSVFLSLQADVGERLATIVQIFDRAEHGDLSLTFEEDESARADRVTVIGAAYNRMRTQLESVVLTDPLTGCYNSRGYEQMLARELARAVRADSTLAVLGVDIDHFKTVNDTYGHLVGDDVLRDVGSLLRRTARLTDVVARTGGEEFTILATDTDEAGAIHLAERIRMAFAAHTFTPLGRRRVTVSIGVASAPARTEDVARLLRMRADEALYAAKRAGRDRTETWRAGITSTR